MHLVTRVAERLEHGVVHSESAAVRVDGDEEGRRRIHEHPVELSLLLRTRTIGLAVRPLCLELFDARPELLDLLGVRLRVPGSVFHVRFLGIPEGSVCASTLEAGPVRRRGRPAFRIQIPRFATPQGRGDGD